MVWLELAWQVVVSIFNDGREFTICWYHFTFDQGFYYFSGNFRESPVGYNPVVEFVEALFDFLFEMFEYHDSVEIMEIQCFDFGSLAVRNSRRSGSSGVSVVTSW